MLTIKKITLKKGIFTMVGVMLIFLIKFFYFNFTTCWASYEYYSNLSILFFSILGIIIKSFLSSINEYISDLKLPIDSKDFKDDKNILDHIYKKGSEDPVPSSSKSKPEPVPSSSKSKLDSDSDSMRSTDWDKDLESKLKEYKKELNNELKKEDNADEIKVNLLILEIEELESLRELKDEHEEYQQEDNERATELESKSTDHLKWIQNKYSEELERTDISPEVRKTYETERMRIIYELNSRNEFDIESNDKSEEKYEGKGKGKD